MNFAILLYLSLHIKSDSSVLFIKDLGIAVYSIINIADLASVIQMSYPGFINLIPYYSPYYKSNYDTLNLIKDEIKFNYENCQAYQKLSTESIIIYTIKDKKLSMKKGNFINYLNEYLTIVLSI